MCFTVESSGLSTRQNFGSAPEADEFSVMSGKKCDTTLFVKLQHSALVQQAKNVLLGQTFGVFSKA